MHTNAVYHLTGDVHVGIVGWHSLKYQLYEILPSALPHLVLLLGPNFTKVRKQKGHSCASL